MRKKSMKGKSIKITPPYRRRIEQSYCCVPAVLQMLVDPAEDSPELCRVELDKLAEALSVRSTGLLGLWVISDVGQSEDFR